MSLTDEQIESVARIAELHSGHSDHPWAGRSLADLLSLTDYATLRPELTEEMLLEWLGGRSKVVEQWIAWSEDKRTSGGYYLQGMPDSRWHLGRVLGSAGGDVRDEDRRSGRVHHARAGLLG
jgi:hypothetical protein